MFFSTDLLCHKGSPFSRIWFLGCDLEKIKSADLRQNVVRLSKAVEDWIKRQDLQALSLPLSSTLHYGTSRIVRRQTQVALRNSSNLETNLIREMRNARSLNQIDLDQVNASNLMETMDAVQATDAEEMGDLTFGGINAPRETITLREPDYENPLGNLQDDDQTFGDDPNIRQRVTWSLFGDEEEDAQEAPPAAPGATENPDDFLQPANPDDFLQPANPADFENTEMNQVESGVDTNAPPRSSGPQNGCREHPPPQFDDPIIQPLDEPMDVDQPTIEEPPRTIVTEPAQDPVQEEPPMELNPVAVPPTPNTRRGIKRKLKIDKNTQITKETRDEWVQNYGDTMKPYPKATSGLTAKQLLGSFPRLAMFKNLKAELEAAAHEPVDEEMEDELAENEQAESHIRDQASTFMRSMADEAPSHLQHETPIKLHPEQDDALIDNAPPLVLDDEDINIDLNNQVPPLPNVDESRPDPALTLSDIPEVTEPEINPTAAEEDLARFQPVITEEDIVSSVTGNNEDLLDIFKKNNLKSRREVSLAFDKILHLEKAGKISCVQQEFFGNILVTKNDYYYYD